MRIVYLMSGKAHLPYLATSLFTLREHWQGEIRVYAWEESFEIAERICNDRNIEADAREREPGYRGRNAQFLDKVKLKMELEDGPNLYLDADTLVVGDLSPLFDLSRGGCFVATRFCNWVTTGRIIQNRVSRLKDYPQIDESLVDEVLSVAYPSVNGGVFVSWPDSPVLKLWQEWSWLARDVFICDECVLHLMVPKFWGKKESKLLVASGVFNSSPRYVSFDESEEVRLWHGHGDSWTRPHKSREGYVMWWKVFEECMERDVGGIREWYADTGNKFLNKCLKQRGMM